MTRRRKLGLIGKVLLIGGLSFGNIFGPKVVGSETPEKTKQVLSSDYAQVEKTVDAENEFGTLYHIRQIHCRPGLGVFYDIIKKIEYQERRLESLLIKENYNSRPLEEQKESILQIKKRLQEQFKKYFLKGETFDSCQREIAKSLRYDFDRGEEYKIYIEGLGKGETLGGEELLEGIFPRYVYLYTQFGGLDKEKGLNYSLSSLGGAAVNAMNHREKPWAKIFGCEDPDYVNLSLEELNRLVILRAPRILEERERKVIEHVLNGKDKRAILVFGSMHNFQDDVLTWNTTNSERQYDLIVVTPNEVRKQDTEIKTEENKTE